MVSCPLFLGQVADISAANPLGILLCLYGFCCRFNADFSPKKLRCCRLKIRTTGEFLLQHVDKFWKISSTHLLLYSTVDFTCANVQRKSAVFPSRDKVCVGLLFIHRGSVSCSADFLASNMVTSVWPQWRQKTDVRDDSTAPAQYVGAI